VSDETETIDDIIIEIGEYENSGGRPSREAFWNLATRIEKAADRAVLAEREACAKCADAEAASCDHLGHDAYHVKIVAKHIRGRK
jgi:hypothetical protein